MHTDYQVESPSVTHFVRVEQSGFRAVLQVCILSDKPSPSYSFQKVLPKPTEIFPKGSLNVCVESLCLIMGSLGDSPTAPSVFSQILINQGKVQVFS